MISAPYGLHYATLGLNRINHPHSGLTSIIPAVLRRTCHSRGKRGQMSNATRASELENPTNGNLSFIDGSAS
jgi:hypothetical protein